MSDLQNLKDQKILITGGAGFIAYHLTETLLRRGARVTSFDNFDEFYSRELKARNVADLQKLQAELGADFVFHEIDFCDPRAFAQLPTDFSFVIHLGAKAGVRPSLVDPLGYVRTNVHGLTALLEWMRVSGLKKLVFGSSSSVYGNSSPAPFTEDMLCDQPISPYAATKRAGELLCQTYSHVYGLQIASLRFFTVYGPRQRPDLAIRKFVAAIQQKQTVTLFGDGRTARDYTYVTDIAEGIIAALAFLQKQQPGTHEIFNLGNSKPTSLLEMLNTIESAMGLKAQLTWEKMQPGDVNLTYADLTKSQHILGYAPKTPFPSGIQQVVDWYRSL